MSLSIRIDISGFIEWMQQTGKEFENFTGWLEKQLAEIVKTQMQQEAPKRTGQLYQSVQIIPMAEGLAVMPTARYAAYVEYGTGLYSRNPHLIYPRAARALRFFVGGNIVFSRYVRGFPGRFYVRRTREAVVPQIHGLLSHLWEEFHRA